MFVVQGGDPVESFLDAHNYNRVGKLWKLVYQHQL